MARMGIEGKADEPDGARIGQIRLCILLLANLREGPVHRLVHLQLKDVDALLVLRHDVGTAVRLDVFHLEFQPLARKQKGAIW